MEIELVSSLSQGIKQILAEIGFSRINKTAEFPESIEVVTTIGITGDLKGTLMLKADRESARTIANKMLLSVNPAEIGNDFGEPQKEAIYEVINLFAGRSLMLLAEKNVDCNLTPPTIITGNKISPAMCDIQFSTNLFFTGDFGNISLFVGISRK